MSAWSWQALIVEDPQLALIELGGSDPFDDVYRQSQAHQFIHGCGLFPAGPAVMQLASMFVRAASACLHRLQTYVRVVGGDWRRGFKYAWQAPDPEPDEGPGLTCRQLTPRHWSGTWETKIRGTVTRDGDSRVAYSRLEDPPGLSPIPTVGRFDTVEAAQVATDEVWTRR